MNYLERVLDKKRKEFQNIHSSQNISRLNNELIDVSNIIQESFQKLLDRDKSFKDMSSKAEKIKDDSKNVSKV